MIYIVHISIRYMKILSQRKKLSMQNHITFKPVTWFPKPAFLTVQVS